MSGRFYILIGSLAASISVLAGAFGAHGLSEIVGARSDVFETAARYHMYHSLGIVLVGILLRRYESRALKTAGWVFLAGIVLFSGSLYLLSVTGAAAWGAVAPVGGVLFVSGWVLVGIGVWRSPRKGNSTYIA